MGKRAGSVVALAAILEIVGFIAASRGVCRDPATKSGEGESPAGWLRYFEGDELIQLVD